MYRAIRQRWRRTMELFSMGCIFINGWVWDAWLAFGKNVSVCLGAVEEERIKQATLLATSAVPHDVAASVSADILPPVEEEVQEEDEDSLCPSSPLLRDITA